MQAAQPGESSKARPRPFSKWVSKQYERARRVFSPEPSTFTPRAVPASANGAGGPGTAGPEGRPIFTDTRGAQRELSAQMMHGSDMRTLSESERVLTERLLEALKEVSEPGKSQDYLASKEILPWGAGGGGQARLTERLLEALSTLDEREAQRDTREKEREARELEFHRRIEAHLKAAEVHSFSSFAFAFVLLEIVLCCCMRALARASMSAANVSCKRTTAVLTQSTPRAGARGSTRKAGDGEITNHSAETARARR